MKFVRSIIAILFIPLITLSCSAPRPTDWKLAIPTGGNSWVINGIDQSSDVISADGISNWTDRSQIIRTYFYASKPGNLSVGLRSKVGSGISKIEVSIGITNKIVTLSTNEYSDIAVGNIKVENPGYHYVDLQGISKEGEFFANISNLLLGGDFDSTSIKFVKDDFYFGRRGPSTHLKFDIPSSATEAEWFYSEIIIPEKQDVIGSYYMANGFGEGYFGIQVNSSSERRILFSIWSPFKTDDPKEIPDDHKIILLRKGEGVHSGEFGNEGSGGQSYKVFDWKSGIKYGFLVGATPVNNNSTDYTAYFFDPEESKWSLIAKFRRPQTSTYLTSPYSFLENFIPNKGNVARKGLFLNQWVRDAAGSWYEIAGATFSADATARKDARLDYSGGSENGYFYLKNFGFSNDLVKIGSEFKRPASNKAPSIDFSSLE